MEDSEAVKEDVLSAEKEEEAPRARTDPEIGLSSEEVAARVKEGKVNGDQNIKTKSVAQILSENIFTFFNFVFILLAVILCFVVDWKGNILNAVGQFGFLLLVFFNTIIGIFQELRAKRTIDKLSLISAPKATVIRDRQKLDIAVSEIVLDDVMLFEAGSQICADAIVTEGSIEVNESLITGEADAVLKQNGDKLMSGSFVVAGNAKAQVEHVGMDNFASKISAGAKYFKKPNSEIWRSLMFIVKVMAFVVVPVGTALFLVKYFLQSGSEFNGGNITLNEYVVTTIGSVVGMIPSGLVALASTVFCVSVIRLSKHKTLAQDLYCVETLARVDVLCLDKTGTITEGTMDVNEVLPLGGRGEDELKQILKDFTSALKDDNATINAIRLYTKSLEVSREATGTVPFSSQRKWSGARFDGVSYVLGAPEFVLRDAPDDIKQKTAEMSEKGFRVMLLASSNANFGENSLPEGLEAVAFVFITDTIRKEAPDTLRFFKEQGVEVKIISGDNPATVRAVAMRAGLEDCDNIIDMSTLSTEEEVREAAEKYTIFGRVLPDQKLTLVNALKAAGHTVAMTGDGVNDVLALKSADCSIAMASGSDAAKNVSSLVLMDSNFASMPRVVAEGRRSINNLERSAALYVMKTLYNTFIALLFLFVPNALPFDPSNLTIIGGVTIGMPSIVLALEPNTDRVTGHFLPKVLRNALPGGLTVLLGAIAVLMCCNLFEGSFHPPLNMNQMSTLFIFIIAFVGFMLLAKVSLPFTWLHFATYLLMIFIFLGVYFIPLPHDFFLDLFKLDNNITWDMGKAILSIAAVLLPIYVGMVFAMRAVAKRHYDYWEGVFERLDNFLKKNRSPCAERRKASQTH